VNINEFIVERKGEWEKLEHIAGKFGPTRQSGRLTRDELMELGRLYMAAVSDLAVLRSSSLASDPDNDAAAYLNSLVVRVHGMIYRKPPFSWSSVAKFLTIGFPSAVRTSAAYVLVSASIFILSGVAGFMLGADEPGFVELVVPEHIIAQVERGRVWFKDLYSVAPQASSALMTHNVTVTFLVVAAGITFGVGTVYLLVINGLILGCVAALCARHGLSIQFWSFVLPHGSLELTAVFIAGAAGLVLGHCLIDPGPYRRRDLLSSRGRLAATLALGCVPLLFLAGITEGYFSPSPLPAWLKFAFAGMLFAWLVTYLSASGRKLEHSDGNQM